MNVPCNGSNLVSPAVALAECLCERRPQPTTKTPQINALVAVREQALVSAAREKCAWAALFGSSLIALVMAFWS